MEKISIAKVIKPQGLKGEIKCLPLAENFNLFSNLKSVYCEEKKINIISSVYRLGYVYIMLENVNSIEEAEKFRGKTFFIEKQDYGELDSSTYFIDELVGTAVYDENNVHIGEVLGVENYGATDILQIKDKWATYLVPFVSKVFISVDIHNNKIVVKRSEYEEHRV